MKKNTLRFTSVLLIAIIVGFAYYYWKIKPAGANKQAGPPSFSMPVEAVEVTAGNASEEINAVGTLEANKIAVVKSEITGKVSKIDFAEGKFIKENGLLAKINDSNYASDLQRAKADYELALANNKRSSSLFKVEAISMEAAESAESAMKQAKANYELAKSRMEKTKIKAPFSGIVGFRNVNIGDLASEGTEITKIVDIAKVKVEFSVAEKYGSKLKVGQEVVVTVDAYPKTTFTGNIYALDPITDPDTRTIHAKALISNKAGKLQPGMTSYLKLKLKTKENVIIIPEEAIVSGEKKTSVFKIIGGIAKEFDVIIGERLDGGVEIVDGVSLGDTIITAGQMKVRDGAPVAAQNLQKEQNLQK